MSFQVAAAGGVGDDSLQAACGVTSGGVAARRRPSLGRGGRLSARLLLRGVSRLHANAASRCRQLGAVNRAVHGGTGDAERFGQFGGGVPIGLVLVCLLADLRSASATMANTLNSTPADGVSGVVHRSADVEFDLPCGEFIGDVPRFRQ